MGLPGQALMKILEALKEALFADGAIPGAAIGGQITDGPQGPLPRGGAPAVHDLVGDRHEVSGETPGQPLIVLTPTTYGFGALDLGNSDAVTGLLPENRGGTNVGVYADGDLLIGDAPGLNVVPIGANGQYLQVVAGLPAWDTIFFADISGVISGIQHGNLIGDTLHALATNSTPGFMSAAQVTKLGLIDDLFDANEVFAGPTTGSPASPGPRILVAADIPTLAASKISGTAVVGGGSGSADRLALFSDANTVTSSANAVYTSSQLRIADTLRTPEVSTPSTPASGFGTWFMSSVGIPSGVDDGGNLYQMRRTIGARVRRTTAQTLTTGTVTALAFDAERYDNGGCHDNSTNNTRLTAPIAGVYDIKGHAAYASNATGVRDLDIRLNGTTVIASQIMPAASGIITTISIGTTYQLAANDYVELLAFQNSGGNLDVSSTGNYSPEFTMEFLRP